MAAETGFLIDGTLYEVPSFDTFTLDEAQILYDYAGLTLEEFVPAEDGPGEQERQADLDRKLKNPGFIRALMHVAYQRGNPKLSPQRVKALVGAANVFEALEKLAAEEGDALPPASTTGPDGSSPTSSVASSESSGDGSPASSAAPVVPLPPTTTSASDTSSASPLETSAA